MDAAVVALREFGSPYHLALGLLDEAEHLAGDDPDRAAALAAEARDIGDRLGCLPIQRRAAAIPGSTEPVALVDVSTV
jgi:hypothetical protein